MNTLLSWVKTHKTFVIITLVVVVLLGAALVSLSTNQASTPENRQEPTPSQEETDQEPMSLQEIMKLPSKDVDLTGVLVCMRLKDGSPPPDQGCPTGLKTDDGKTYDLRELRNDGQPLLRGKPFGKPIAVSGKLYQADTEYQTDGVLVMSSAEMVQ